MSLECRFVLRQDSKLGTTRVDSWREKTEGEEGKEETEKEEKRQRRKKETG